MRLQPIDPAVADAVAELLLLPPQDRLGQIALEGFAQHRLLDALAAVGAGAGHLVLGVHAHGHVQELHVQERHARLHAPGHHRLVGAQAIVVVQRVELADQFFVEFARVRRLVEVQVAAEDLVAAFAGEHHLHPHRLDPPRQQEHRRGGADGGDVVGLDVPDHLRQRVQAFLEGVLEAVVHRAQRLGGDRRGGQIRRALQADRERVQARPPGLGLVVLLDALACEARRHRRDQRRIQSTGEQHAVRHVGHQLAMHGALEGLAQFLLANLHALHRRVVAPRLAVVLHQCAAGAVVVVARRELGDVGATVGQRLHLRGHPQPPLRIMAPVQRAHAHRIARDQHAPGGLVPQRESEDAVEAVQQRVRRGFAVQRVDHLAVRAGLEGVWLHELLLQFAMVVDLAVDRQRQLPVVGKQRLRTAGRVDDGQALVDQDRAVVDIHAAPVRAAVALPLRAVQRLPPQRLQVVARLQAEDAEDRTHGKAPDRGVVVAEGRHPGTKKPASADAGFLAAGRGVSGSA
ncbi:hypothetical protein NB689_002214 [Xanthomonas sacchari]|nr:hypothetical protein [Xanthomonas sacchari]